MLPILLSLTAFAAPPAWLDGCTATGDGHRLGLSCPGFSASQYDGPAAEPKGALTAMSDGFANATTSITEVRRDPAAVPGAAHSFVQVFTDAQGELFMLRAVKPRPDGLRLVECTVRAPSTEQAISSCEDVVVYILENGVPTKAARAPANQSGVEKILGGAVAAPAGCEARRSTDKMEFYCPDGMMVLMGVPAGRTGAELIPGLQAQTAEFYRSQGGTDVKNGSAACGVRGKQTECQTLSATVPGMGALRSTTFTMAGAGGEVLAVCTGPTGVPAVCAPYVTGAPAFP